MNTIKNLFLADDNFYNTSNLLDVHVDNDNFYNNLLNVDDDNFNSNSGDVADDKDECDEVSRGNQVEKNVTSEGKKITKKKEKNAKPVLKACCCKKKYYEKIDDVSRNKINVQFWSKTFTGQGDWLMQVVKPVDVKRERVRSQERMKTRKCQYLYFLNWIIMKMSMSARIFSLEHWDLQVIRKSFMFLTKLILVIYQQALT